MFLVEAASRAKVSPVEAEKLAKVLQSASHFNVYRNELDLDDVTKAFKLESERERPRPAIIKALVGAYNRAFGAENRADAEKSIGNGKPAAPRKVGRPKKIVEAEE